MNNSRRSFSVALAALALALLAHAPALSADRTLSVEGFYIYPDAQTKQRSLTSFAWPGAQSLSVMVQVHLGGYTGKEKLDLFLVLFEGDKVVKKSKGKHTLPAGNHDLVFSDFLRTDAVFETHNYRLELEAGLKGAAPVRQSLDFEVCGPDAPHVQILETQLYNPQWGRGAAVFAPGGDFQFEALIEISDNPGSVAPRAMVYGAMEEDSRDVDPAYEYQPYNNQWDAAVLPGKDGEFRISAHGRLPYFFAQPWDNRHAFRVYVSVDFGAGERKDDYARAELSDPDPGDHRRSDDIAARLIELDRNYLWEIRRLRAGTPDPGDTWR
jgi:hypothetical protein